MDIPVKKLKNGFELPVFGFGTWQMGGREERDYQNDDAADVMAIKNALDLGITHFDTAEFYAEGHAEELLSQALKGIERSKIIITTKAVPMNFRYTDLIKALHGSLKRLKTDYVDVYLLHAPNPYIPIEETMEAMDHMMEKGYIRYIGLSNYDSEQFKKAQSCTENKIVTDHVHYNIKYRLPQRDGTIGFAQKNDVMIVAWRPVQKGLFCSGENAILKKVCRKYGKSANQIAINWLISQKNITTITKCRSLTHLKENLGALGWQMEKEDIDFIDKDFKGKKYCADVATLTDKIRP
jgi:diketogulonate reductase-like aldo/keto reductase